MQYVNFNSMKFKLFNLAIFLLIVLNQANASNCANPTASINLEINNVRAKLLNGGDMFWDIFGAGMPGYEIPKVTSGERSIHSSFTASLMLGGIDVGNNLYTAGQTYRQRGLDFWPGALNAMGQIDSIDCDDWNEMFNITGKEINDAKSGKGISYNMSRWPSSHAPFYDANSDGIYDPSLGDYPVLDLNNINTIPGQMVYWVINDMGGPHTAYTGGNPMGVEIQNFAYAFSSSTSDAINNTTMYRYIITNKSNTTFTEFRIGNYNDFEIGGADDDYIGCDLSVGPNNRKRNLFYAYNADNDDEDMGGLGYGNSPPAFGITYLNPGKTSNNPNVEIGSFILIYKGGLSGSTGFPTNATELYRYLKGRWADNLPIMYGLNGRNGTDSCLYMFPGNTDPLGRPNWVETDVPGDRRAISAVKSVHLAPGEKVVTDFAYVWARDTFGNNLSSVEKLKLSTDTVQTAYQNFYSNYSTGVIQVKAEKIIIYPNPANDILCISGIQTIQKIKIYNSQAKLVREIIMPIERKINIANLPSGSYYIQINNNYSKFVKL